MMHNIVNKRGIFPIFLFRFAIYSYVGDCQMGLALQMFLDTHGLELLKKNLYRNFILHLNNLYDFGIITPATVLRTIGSLQLMLQRSPEHQEILKQAWHAQLNN